MRVTQEARFRALSRTAPTTAGNSSGQVSHGFGDINHLGTLIRMEEERDQCGAKALAQSPDGPAGNRRPCLSLCPSTPT